MLLVRGIFLLALLLSGCAAQQNQHRPLTILHLNDLHARLLPDAEHRGGFAHVAEAIRQEKAKSEFSLVMHGGDLVQGTPVSTIFKGVPVYEVANTLGLDFHTLGNHEFDYGWRKISEFVSTAEFPTLNANVVDGQGNLLVPKPYVIGEVGGIRVGVIGILTAELVGLTKTPLRGPWKALPVTETVSRYVDEIEDRTDLIVVLSHIFPREEDEILRANRRVPLIISGHHHGGQDEVKTFEGRICVKTRPYGRELGRLDIEFDLKRKQIVSHQWKRIPIDSRKYPADQATAKLVEKWEAKVSEIVDVPIGRAARRISRGELKPMIEQAIADAVDADLAYMNRGGIRDELPEGPLLARHVWNVLPFGNLISVAPVPGNRLPPELANGKTVDPNRIYRVATNDFMGGKWREMGLPFSEDGKLVREVMIEWIKNKKVIR